MVHRKLHSLFVISAVLCLSNDVLAQSVIGSAGTEHSGADGSVAFTVGEAVIATVGTTPNVLTQGFNQPWVDISTAVDDPSDSDGSITVFPNPVSHMLHVSFSEAPVDHHYELFDASGRRITDGRIAGPMTDLDMEPYASGGYVLRILGAQDSTVRSFKITVAQ